MQWRRKLEKRWRIGSLPSAGKPQVLLVVIFIQVRLVWKWN